MVDGRTTTDDGARLYYKLTNEPKDSGVLKIAVYLSDSRVSKLYPLVP